MAETKADTSHDDVAEVDRVADQIRMSDAAKDCPENHREIGRQFGDTATSTCGSDL